MECPRQKLTLVIPTATLKSGTGRRWKALSTAKSNSGPSPLDRVARWICTQAEAKFNLPPAKVAPKCCCGRSRGQYVRVVSWWMAVFKLWWSGGCVGGWVRLVVVFGIGNQRWGGVVAWIVLILMLFYLWLKYKIFLISLKVSAFSSMYYIEIRHHKQPTHTHYLSKVSLIIFDSLPFWVTYRNYFVIVIVHYPLLQVSANSN